LIGDTCTGIYRFIAVGGPYKRPSTGQVRRWPAECTCPPSSLKRDCARRTTSRSGKGPVNVHAKSRLILATSTATPVRDQGPGGSLPGPDAGHPLYCAGGHDGDDEDQDVEVLGADRNGSHGYERLSGSLDVAEQLTGTHPKSDGYERLSGSLDVAEQLTRTHPKSETDLNGLGLQSGHLQIRRPCLPDIRGMAAYPSRSSYGVGPGQNPSAGPREPGPESRWLRYEHLKFRAMGRGNRTVVAAAPPHRELGLRIRARDPRCPNRHLGSGSRETFKRPR
jgi:hypothetical protein